MPPSTVVESVTTVYSRQKANTAAAGSIFDMFYLRIEKNSNSAQLVVQMLFCN